jgi:DNA replication protein DnaC
MSDPTMMLLKVNLKQLRLPAMAAQYAPLAREAAEANQGYPEYLLRLTELEVAARAANALKARLKQAAFPVLKDFDTFDFSLLAHLSKPKVLELARGEWIDRHENCCLIGSPGTGKTHLAVALGQAACRQGRRVRFFTAGALVTRLEEAQKAYQLERFLGQLDKADLVICDELGYLSFSRTGAELLFQVFADRYERASLLVTSNLAFSDWGQVFQGERMTAALLDRLTHRCHIFETSGESYRFRQSMKAGQNKGPPSPPKAHARGAEATRQEEEKKSN